MRDVRTILALSVTLLTTFAYAADVQMNVQPQLISLLDRAVLKIEFIDTKGDAVDIPPVDGLQIQYQGQSSETRIVNFNSTSKVVHTYVVTPTKVGDYTIGPVTCNYKGGTKELTAQLRVVKPKDDPEAQQLSQIMFSRITTDRETLHVHEPFGLELKIYLRDGVQIDGNFGIRGGIPESGIDGDLEWTIVNRSREERDGAIFNVYTLRTTVKTLTAGTFTFQPQVQLNIVVPSQRRRSFGFDDPFFGDLFGRQETRPMVLDCNELAIEVKPVPTAGRPASFTGGVGTFDFDVSIGPEQVKAGEPITVKMRIRGTGNLTQITPPKLAENHNLKLYEARTVPAQSDDEVRFEQVVIPTSETVTNLPAIAFSYFDTRTADFRTIRKGPFPIRVEAMPEQVAQVIATAPSTITPETRVLGRDIVYLKPRPNNWQTADATPWYATLAFRLLLALPPLLLALTAGWSWRRSRLAGNVALARRQKAPKAARAYLAAAEKALKKQDETAFHEALWNAIAHYFGHRLNLAPGDITLASVLARMPDSDGQLAALFHTVEQRRYSRRTGPGARDEMAVLLRQCTRLLKTCERMKL